MFYGFPAAKIYHHTPPGTIAASLADIWKVPNSSRPLYRNEFSFQTVIEENWAPQELHSVGELSVGRKSGKACRRSGFLRGQYEEFAVLPSNLLKKLEVKTYSFTPISAREYPTVQILDHPYIWGGVSFCINVSEKPYSRELEMAMTAHSIEWIFCPVSEDEGESWMVSMEKAVRALYEAYRAGKKTIVHCDWGNNRSRSFIEAFHFVLCGEHLHDEYKGEFNHLAYNCKVGHLPPLPKTEEWLNSLIDSFTDQPCHSVSPKGSRQCP